MPRVLALVALVAACSSRPPHGRTPVGGAPDAAPAAPDAAPVAPPPDAGPAPLTRDECDQLIDHVLRAQVATMRGDRAPDKVPTEEDVTAAHAALSAQLMDQCLAWDRPSFDCIMAATDLPAIQACAGEP